MNMNCRVLLTLTLLATLHCQAAGKLIMKPKNTDTKVNDTTYFNCSTDIGSKDIFWFHGDTYVYIGSAILEPYTERFKIDRHVWNGTYIYNLVIHSVQPSDAGEYICFDDEKYGDKYSVQLVVSEDDPICRSNMKLDEVIGQNTCNIEPDKVDLDCSVTYHGNIPPQMEWKKVGENSSTPLEVSVVTSRNHFISTLKLKGDIALNNSSYVCETKRTTQESNKCTSEVIKILYALGDNSTANKSINDEILCQANTTQSCNYKWRWFDGNDVTTESSSEILKPKKLGWHKCEADCYLRNKTCNLLVVQTMVYGETVVAVPEKSTPQTVTISVVVTVVVTLVVVGVLICVFIICRPNVCKRRRSPERNATYDEEMTLFKTRNTGAAGNPNGPVHTANSEEHETLLGEAAAGNVVSPSDLLPFGQENSEEPSIDPLSNENFNTPAEEPPSRAKACQESDVIGSNYQFLVENIKGSVRFIDLLHEKECITNEERDHFNKQPDNFSRNEALLQWMRTITFKIEKLQKVLECLRQAEQNLIADILEKGGVVIKSKISITLLNERQICSLLTKSSNTNTDGHKEEEAMVIEILKQPQGLSLSSIESTTSEIPDDDIVIAPYCHQEANGIVIWFWCESKIGERNLKSMCESDNLGLLEKLITIFKEFVNESVSSLFEILVENGITIFVGDFTKNETIYGLAFLDKEVFISRLLCPEIEVYDSMTFRLKRRIKVQGMKNPENLVSCSLNKCLYAFDWDYQEENASDWDNQGQIHAILRIDPTNGNPIKTWKVDGRGGRLSVASDTNVILNINYEAKLHEYTAVGVLIRMIDLDPMCTDINRSWHALKLDNGEFVVCHGGEGDPLSRVCLLSVKSKSSIVGRTDEAEMLEAFDAEQEESINRLTGPTYLSVDKEGSILVSYASHQTVLLSSNLKERQIIVSKEHGLGESRTTCFDESTDQWFVAGQRCVMVCRVKDKEVERKLFYLMSH